MKNSTKEICQSTEQKEKKTQEKGWFCFQYRVSDISLKEDQAEKARDVGRVTRK